MPLHRFVFQFISIQNLIQLIQSNAEPSKQFALVAHHIQMLRLLPGKSAAPIVVYVERNLGFEAEHHKRALDGLPGVCFHIDHKANRVGVLTTEAIKHAMCQLVVVMLRERRIHVHRPLVSKDEKGVLLRLREQMEVYSYQFKLGTTTFQKDRVALSGKVGGMKDDICICLQLACYHTQLDTQRAAQGLASD